MTDGALLFGTAPNYSAKVEGSQCEAMRLRRGRGLVGLHAKAPPSHLVALRRENANLRLESFAGRKLND